MIVIKGLARGDSVYQLTGTCRGAIHFVRKNWPKNSDHIVQKWTYNRDMYPHRISVAETSDISIAETSHRRIVSKFQNSVAETSDISIAEKSRRRIVPSPNRPVGLIFIAEPASVTIHK